MVITTLMSLCSSLIPYSSYPSILSWWLKFPFHSGKKCLLLSLQRVDLLDSLCENETLHLSSVRFPKLEPGRPITVTWLWTWCYLVLVRMCVACAWSGDTNLLNALWRDRQSGWRVDVPVLTAAYSLDSLLGVGHCNGGSEPDVRLSSPCGVPDRALADRGQEDGGLHQGLLGHGQDHGFGSDAVIPSPRQAEDYFSGQYLVAFCCVLALVFDSPV